MKLINYISYSGILCLLVSCEKPVAPAVVLQPVSEVMIEETRWADHEFTNWMSRAELQFLQDQQHSEDYFAYIEGRHRNGLLEYRAIIEEFPDEFEQWAVSWGIDEAELFKWELELLRTGFTRKESQVFHDFSGKAIHQIVWLKKRGQAILSPNPPIAENPSEVSAESSTKPVPPEPVEPTKPVVAAVTQESMTYIVKPGDTLGKIATRSAITIPELKALNRLQSDSIRIGQKLELPKNR